MRFTLYTIIYYAASKHLLIGCRLKTNVSKNKASCALLDFSISWQPLSSDSAHLQYDLWCQLTSARIGERWLTRSEWSTIKVGVTSSPLWDFFLSCNRLGWVWRWGFQAVTSTNILQSEVWGHLSAWVCCGGWPLGLVVQGYPLLGHTQRSRQDHSALFF